VTAPSLVTIARRALTGEAKLARGSTLLVATSGGPDSMALLDVVVRLQKTLGIGVVAHGVDHGLRAEAPAELDLAELHAKASGVPFGRTRVTVEPGGNLQARAREERLRALLAAAKKVRATAIATAHHADDRAETLLLRLLRGAGPAGLAVLPARAPVPLDATRTSIELVRPLLRARRADVHAHLERHGLTSATDPSNADPRYLRVRVRTEVLPLLEELSPGIVEHLAALADQLAGADKPPPIPRATLEALGRLLRSGSRAARVWLPGGLVVARGSKNPASKSDEGRRMPRTSCPRGRTRQNRPKSSESDPR
jgi:tRNA(Ile)-lysidine synthase